MSKKKKEEKVPELSPASIAFMKKELQALTDEMIKEAGAVVEEYEEKPSELEGNTFQIDAESPFLDDRFTGEDWKHFVHPAALKDKGFLKMMENIRKKKKSKKSKKK
jgi:hypothetical protein